jgi:tRNA/tmRNA/rRNA uracil-C5-methylase (TrmA/RlmC/RlmD family)
VDQPIELALGQRLILNIEDIGFGGEGVGRAGEFVIFVPFVAIGEEVEVEVTEVKKRFGRARLLRVLKPSALRVAPRCRYFGECGGCQYQHLDYPEQLRLKHKQIRDLFERVGGFTEPPVDAVVPCPQPYGYRNRIMIRSQWNKFKQALNIGFIRVDNRLVVDLDECLIAEDALNEQIKQVRRNPPPRGGIKVVLRVAPEGWEVPRDSFFQNNFHLLPRLVDTVRERLRLGGTRFLIDAYCGVGFFSLELAASVERFLGVELDASAIRAAKKNAANRGAVNGDFVAGRTEDLLPGMLQAFDRGQTALILDPPRTGCPPDMMRLLREQRPAQVLYISCHPATLARDLNVLCSDGVFNLAKIVPLDMFPQTQHVECVADLRASSQL